MSESASTLPPARYDVIFTGATAPGHDPEAVRRGLQALFRLDDAHAERLLRAGRVVVKRGVDLDTARRFQSAFIETGALVEIEPAVLLEPTAARVPADTGPGEPAPASAEAPSADADADVEETIIATAAVEPDPPTGRRAPAPGDAPPWLGRSGVGERLDLAPPGAPLDEIDDRVPIPFPDISALSVEPGDDWTLADCPLPTPAAVLPPIDHLRLEPISPRPPRGAGDRLDRPETAHP